jgi:hypothetical protein
MQKRILDASGGVLTEFHTDDQRVVINRIEDTNVHAGANKSLRDERIGSVAGSSRGHILYKTSSVPAIIIEKWCNDFGVNVLGLSKEDYNNFVKDRLNEPEYVWLRTAPDSFYKRKRGWQYYTRGVSTLAPTAGDLLKRAA